MRRGLNHNCLLVWIYKYHFMKKKYCLIFFAFVLIVELVAVQFNLDMLKFIFKPLIILSLIAYFLTATNSIAHSLKPLIVYALIFSWMGDVLLMFESKNSMFFIFGLISFLIAHLFYVYYFHRIRLSQSIAGSVYLLIPVVIFYFTLMYILEPYLGSLKLPVRIYGIVISFMLLLALHMLKISNRSAGKLFALGALLFVSSDALLAINKFYSSFPMAGLSIILTYGLAQFFIVKGAISYFASSDTKSS